MPDADAPTGYLACFRQSHTLDYWSTLTTLSNIMPETLLNLYEAKTSLSKLVDRAASGEEIIIAKAGRPLAKLVPLHHKPPTRKPGGWKGKLSIADDFDAPLPKTLLDAFEGRR